MSSLAHSRHEKTTPVSYRIYMLDRRIKSPLGVSEEKQRELYCIDGVAAGQSQLVAASYKSHARCLHVVKKSGS